MSNIASAFENKKAFIPFITCGDPDLATTEECVVRMEKAGASLIELGIPFSDPTAEGPVIQAASIRALEAGATTDKIFEMVMRLREVRGVKVPMVFMTYANVVFSYGAERFCEKAKACGISGCILPDVPYEEKGEFADVFAKYDMDLISLVSPASEDRIQMISADATGFIYVVSSLGVTGVRSSITTDIHALCAKIKESSKVPCAVGFGISTPEQAADIARFADGIIIGSAIVKLIGKYGEEADKPVYEFVKSVREALDK